MNRRSLLLATPFLGLAAQAQELPARPIRLMVPFTTGGTTDVLARILSEHGPAEFGQPIIVESRPGAGGVTGTAQVAAAAPDGTSLVMGTPGPIATAPALMSSLPYDPLRDLAPVMLVANVPNLVVVNPSSGITSIAQLIAAARARPGAIHFGSAGIGATTHLAGELFKLMTGVDIVHVPYRGSVPALTDLQGGQIQLMFENMPGAIELVRAGRLTGLAVTSPNRAMAAPDIPTVAETVPGYSVVSWFALFTGGQVPAPVVQRLNAGFRRIMARPAVRQRILELGAEPADGTPEALGQLAREETERWGRVIREARISVQ
ncbi:tripartite tricarboxylate transporter substrate binding protein [Roseococcus sp. SDR]|uniref:Bug family tripartite tricarboxylate transporter substrate binding protein n=1 Tax=Roseococcus sp. SDR TaxID=2835532 RepID=UPI001BCAD831|nr:tripartite tricarboxylate transporter substrate binding protein [Roseococcus sp. SDR]MBS7790802.1 tripartite tricarboxylate transporter substrate binding protein [Roseococcus sp. SDR]MBV1846116.1 tripartite tricarboxylate transporter substrate binding protein [Roseococcus sp. SDR]